MFFFFFKKKMQNVIEGSIVYLLLSQCYQILHWIIVNKTILQLTLWNLAHSIWPVYHAIKLFYNVAIWNCYLILFTSYDIVLEQNTVHLDTNLTLQLMFQVTAKTLAQHDELMKKTETMSILVQTNKMLREEKDKINEELQQTQAKVLLPFTGKI